MDEATNYAARLDRLSVLACIAVPSFMAMFAWYRMWPLVIALAACGPFLVTCSLIYRRSGSIFLSREAFLVALFAFKFYEIVYFGTILSPGSLWMVGLPVIAVMVGSIASGVFWIVTTISAIVLFTAMDDFLATAAVLTPSQMQITYGFSLIYLVICLSIFVLLVDYERKLAIVGLAKMNETVRRLVISDPLTGLFNRRHLGDLMVADDAKAAGERTIRCLMMIDIDRFKAINDRFGHLAGDIVIKSVADAIASEAGETNPVGRFGGEEFVCLVRTGPASADAACAKTLAEAIRRRVADLAFDDIAGLGSVTVSIGFAECARFGSAQTALAEADTALYAAKNAGRDCTREARPKPAEVAKAS